MKKKKRKILPLVARFTAFRISGTPCLAHRAPVRCEGKSSLPSSSRCAHEDASFVEIHAGKRGGFARGRSQRQCARFGIESGQSLSAPRAMLVGPGLWLWATESSSSTSTGKLRCVPETAWPTRQPVSPRRRTRGAAVHRPPALGSPGWLPCRAKRVASCNISAPAFGGQTAPAEQPSATRKHTPSYVRYGQEQQATAAPCAREEM